MTRVVTNGKRKQDYERTPIHFLVDCVLDVVHVVGSIGGSGNENAVD